MGVDVWGRWPGRDDDGWELGQAAEVVHARVSAVRRLL